MAKRKKVGIPVVIVLVLIIVALAAALVGPKVVHECADCRETFFGAAYEPSKLVEFFDDSNEEMVICEKCAEEQHSISIATGKTLEDFKIEIF